MNGVKTDPHGAEDIAHRSPAFNPIKFDEIKKQAGLNSFILSAKQWTERTCAQLVCLSNLENLNALLIGQALPQPERLTRLNQIAIQQMKLLTADERTPQLPEGKKEK